MFYGLIDSASLKNPTILNDFSQLKVKVQYESHSTTSKYHYNFLLEFSDKNINTAISKIQREMRSSWYSFFWSKSILYIVFGFKKFKIDLPNGWTSDEYKAAQKFGKSQNIPDEYLDYKIYFQPYKNIVDYLEK
ncbi:hypothetical protein A3J20_00555 [Candidatus Gottesmanbacteria bacterium RIFCSPLOWO2_02_FULL_42_29]|nr:MAG: hypothetical protein A3J20_00555 [Candidatus Gottesmanbacteria bacterium RIFCSPLOWO2_02_FULL_42_29]